jgi:hypothetical protein
MYETEMNINQLKKRLVMLTLLNSSNPKNGLKIFPQKLGISSLQDFTIRYLLPFFRNIIQVLTLSVSVSLSGSSDHTGYD